MCNLQHLILEEQIAQSMPLWRKHEFEAENIEDAPRTIAMYIFSHDKEDIILSAKLANHCSTSRKRRIINIFHHADA